MTRKTNESLYLGLSSVIYMSTHIEVDAIETGMRMSSGIILCTHTSTQTHKFGILGYVIIGCTSEPKMTKGSNTMFSQFLNNFFNFNLEKLIQRSAVFGNQFCSFVHEEGQSSEPIFKIQLFGRYGVTSIIEEQGQEDQEYNVILSYVVNLRTART